MQKAVAGGTTSRYFGQLFVKVGSGWRERIVANGEVIAIVNVSVTGYVTTDYLVHDNLGSPAVLLDASGNLAARFAWNAWGELVDPMIGFGHDPDATQKEALTTLGYTGHEMFWQAGLVQTWARLYNPAIGRWLSPDPTVPGLYNSQALNRYSYVLNNPLTLVDANGHQPDIPYGWATANQARAYYAYAAEVMNWSAVGIGVGHLAIGTITFAGIGVQEFFAPETAPWAVLEAGFASTQAAQGLQDIWNGFGGKSAMSENPLSAFVGKTNNEAAEAALEAGEIIANARNPYKIGTIIEKHLAGTAVNVIEGGTSGGGGAGGGGFGGRTANGGGIGLLGLLQIAGSGPIYGTYVSTGYVIIGAAYSTMLYKLSNGEYASLQDGKIIAIYRPTTGTVIMYGGALGTIVDGLQGGSCARSGQHCGDE